MHPLIGDEQTEAATRSAEEVRFERVKSYFDEDVDYFRNDVIILVPFG